MSFTPNSFRNPQQTPIKDWWNILLFVALTLGMGYAFDHFVMKPREAAERAYQTAQIQAQQIALQSNGGMAASPFTPAPRDVSDVLAEGPRIIIKNDVLTAQISVERGRIDDVELSHYFTTIENTEPVRVLAPVGTQHPAVSETGWASANSEIRVPGPKTIWAVSQDNTEKMVHLAWDNGQGLVFTRSFILDNKYVITVKDSVQNTGITPVTLTPYALLSQHGVPADLSPGIVHEGAIGYVGNNYFTTSYGSWDGLEQAPETYANTTGWIGITTRYFFIGLIPDQKDQTIFRTTFRGIQNITDINAQPRFQVDTQGSARIVQPGKSETSIIRIFAGAKELKTLESYQKSLSLNHFDLVVDYGWFYFLTQPFYHALVFIYGYVGNFGVAILIFTLILRLAVFPLANTSFKSFAKMKVVGPQIQEIQKTYVNDRPKMQEELVKLYTKEKVNPVSGCLPILVQIPIFFAMYKVISVSIDMRHAPFFGWIKDLTAPDPTSLFNLFGLLPYDVHPFLHFGAWPFLLFIMVMIQTRLSPPPPDRMMHIFFHYYYPIMIAFIMAKFASGLVIYWAFSAFLSVAQQMLIMYRMNVPIHLFERLQQSKKIDPPS